MSGTTFGSPLMDSVSGNNLIIALNQAGFDENDVSSGKIATGTTSARLKKAGQLWQVCLQFEASNSEVLRGNESRNDGYSANLALVAMARASCCHLWLDSMNDPDFRDKWCKERYLQLVFWMVEASDSLVLSRQFSALINLLDRLDMNRLQKIAECRFQSSLQHEEEPGDRWMPFICLMRLRLCKSYASMQTQSQFNENQDIIQIIRDGHEYLSRIKDVHAQVYCDSNSLEIQMHFVYLLLKGQASRGSTRQQEDLSIAKQILQCLAITSSRLSKNCSHLGSVWERRLTVCLMWCLLNSFALDLAAKELPTTITASSYLVNFVAEAVACLDNVEHLENQPDLNMQQIVAKRLDDMLQGKSPGAVEALALPCSALLSYRRGARCVIITYASSVCGQSDHGRKFLLSVLGHLLLQLDSAYISHSPEVCDVIASIVANNMILEFLQNKVDLARGMYALLWNSISEAGLPTNKTLLLLSSTQTLAELIQDPSLIQNNLIQLACAHAQIGELELAEMLALKLEKLSPLGSAMVRLEIEAGKGCTDIEAVEDLVRVIFAQEIVDQHDGFDMIGLILKKKLLAGVPLLGFCSTRS